MTAPRCPRCGGTRPKPKRALAPGENPWAYRPGERFPLCGHEFHGGRS